LALLLLGLATTPAVAAEGPPEPVSLTEGWEFQLSTRQPAIDSLAWAKVSLPHVFDSRPLEALYGGTVGWYRLRFRAPAAVPDLAWDIRFESVRRAADVYLNGEQIGQNRDPYTPFSLPAGGLLPDQTNELLVRVSNRKPSSLREGWWNWGGIIRQVELVPRGRVALEELGLVPRVSCDAEGSCRASFIVEGLLQNRTDQTLKPRANVTLSSPAGELTEAVGRLPELAPAEKTRFRLPVKVRGVPALWAPDHPRLYRASVSLTVEGEVQQVEQRNVGLRSVKSRHGLLYLNGRRIQLRGASIQEDFPGRGPALRDQDIERIVADLKAVGANVTRAHYLLNDRLLTRFDEEGILVWSQAPIYHRDTELRDPDYRKLAVETVRRTVLSARNHPSVLTHSVANELDDEPDRKGSIRLFMEEAAEVTRDLDSSVPVSVDILTRPRSLHRQRTYKAFDLLGVNTYFGWYGRADALRRLRPYLRRLRRNYPELALVMTEFGAEGIVPDGPRRQKGSFGFQADYLNRVLKVVDGSPFMSGAIYWTLHEFAVKPRWDGGTDRAELARDGIHNKGLIGYDGKPKPAWFAARERFRAIPLYRK